MAEPAISPEAHAAVLSIIERKRAQEIERMIASGSIDPDCAYCRRNIMAYESPANVMAPRHTASPRCQSGGHPHCTCDTCF